MKFFSILYMVALLLVSSGFKEISNTVTLEIKIENCRSSKGKMYFALYRQSKGFLEVKSAYKLKVFDIKDKRASLKLSNLPKGQYAFTCYHDENNNGKLDKNILGIPREGYGFSNNARGTFGPPSFKQCVFTIDDKAYQRVKLSY